MADNVLNLGYNATPAYGLAATLRLRADATVFNGSAYEAWSDGNIGNYLVALSNSGGGFWGAGMPSGVTPAVLVVDYFDKLAASPASLSDLLLLKSRTINWNGSTATAVPAGYTGRYTSVGLCKTYRGITNITEWSSTDGTGTEDTNAETYAINVAEDFIDNFFSNARYTIPFVAATGRSPLPYNLIDWATVLATVNLYQKRGIYDADPASKLEKDRQRVLKEMREVFPGYPFSLYGVHLSSSGPSPAVTIVEPRTNSISDDANLAPTDQSKWAGRQWRNGVGWI